MAKTISTEELKKVDDEAIEYIRDRRPSIHIEDVQKDSLKRFYDKYKK